MNISLNKTIFFINKYAFWIFFGMLLLGLMPMFFLNENSIIGVIDQLDCEFIHRIILSRDGNWLKGPTGIIESFMSGIPRHNFPTSISLLLLFVILFKPITAIFVNILLIHIIAYIGMFFLLKKHILADTFAISMNTFLVSSVAFCFSFLSFYYWIGGISIAGQPLLFYAFLNILKKETRFTDLLIILCFPLYSSFVFAGIYIVIALGFIYVINWIQTRKFHCQFLLMLMLFAVIYFIIEHQLLYGLLFDKNFVSHRTEWNLAVFDGLDIYGVIDRIWFMIFNGYAHAKSNQYCVINFILPVAFVVGMWKSLKLKQLGILLGIIFLIILYSSFLHWIPIRFYMQPYALFKSIHFDRFFILLPLLWHIVTAISLSIISKAHKYGTYLLAFFLFLQMYTVVTKNWDVRDNFKLFCKKYICSSIAMNDKSSFRHFFSTKLFSQITTYINRPLHSYKVINLGLYPCIAQYNGIYTLDGYIQNYPLNYKHEFRKIIEKELRKNEVKRNEFDNWGSRCYLFVNEVPNLEAFKNSIIIKNLELNTTQLKKMKCEYVLSAFEIQNYKQNNLKFIKHFEDKESPWSIFLYQT